MAKDPAMLWYWSDWHSGTTTFSRFLKGCYMDVLHAQFNSGHLTLEEIKTVLGSDFGTAWPTLQKKFTVDETGKYFNRRLEEEKEKRASFTKSRRNNLESKKPHMDKHMDSHMNKHMENENRNEDVIEIKYKKESEIFDSTIAIPEDQVDIGWMDQTQVLESLMLDEIYIEQLQMTHRGKDIKQAFGQCYIHHSNAPNPPKDIRGWKQKLNTWLSNTRTNGTGKKGESINSRREGFAKRHSADAGG